MADEKPQADPAAAIAAIRDARPPATDPFTYLTILEANLSVDVLATLDEILHDAELTQQIGWDLVYNLVSLPGSDACLETIARLGNPREVILKVLETLELLAIDRGGSPVGDEVEELEAPSPPKVPKEQQFMTLLGMLAILHKRIKTKYPSRFLAQTLQTVYNTYQPTQEVTAAVINLVHSLSGRRRPALPSRKSSVNVVSLGQDGDGSRDAPDPEAEEKDDKEDPAELAMQSRLLLSFATCVLETYTNTRDMGWAARLLEFYQPERVVPGRKTLMAAFREEQELLERDAIVGQLVALVRDLGIESADKKFLEVFSKHPIISNPLSRTDDAMSPADVALSTGGCVALVAYWVFSATVFDADQPVPEMDIFPDHFVLLEKLLQDDAESLIRDSSGTIEALVVIGLWLQQNKRISASPDELLTTSTPVEDDVTSDFMRYLHLITLIAVYHPNLQLRNTASTLAGRMLHADPSEEDRLRILYDLLENCMYPTLKACAITWLREEILSASPTTAPPGASGLFSTSQPLEEVQYAVFPSLESLGELDAPELVEYLGQHAPFLLQAVNFGLFLWTAPDRWAHVLPANADATVRERWFRPLADAVERVRQAGTGGEDLGPLAAELDVLKERMARLADTDGFKRGEDEADRT